MKVIHCKYHAAIPARWHCAECQLKLCTQCAPKQAGSSTPPCPSCRTPTQSLGIGNTIKPFWERIPRFFAYPAKSGPLVMAISLSLGGLLALFLFRVFWPLALVALFAIVSAATRYCYRVLFHTARGHLEPPEGLGGNEYQNVFWKQIALYLILFGGAGFVVAFTGSMVLGIAAFAFVMFVIPAATITLAVKDSLLSAVNPLQLLGVSFAIGWSYLLLWLMLILLSGGQSFLIEATTAVLPPAAAVVMFGFITIYFYIAMFHMMGYVVYQFHEQLGFSVAEDYSESSEAAGEYGQQASLVPPPDRVQILITEGKYEEALSDLTGLLRESPDDLRLHDRYFRLMLTQADKKDDGAAHADLYIGKLLAQNQREKALDVYRDGSARWGALEIKDAGDAVQLANHAHQRGQSKLALPMLSRFPQRFPGHEKIPAAMLLSAEALSQGLGKDEMALQILKQLQTAYPEHPLRPRVDQLSTAVQRLLQRKTAPSPKTA